MSNVLTPDRATETVSLNGVRVLVIDDCAENRDAVAEMLCASGCSVEQASTAEEALKKLELFEPEVVLTDVVMPGLSGLELIRILRERNFPGGAIVMSGYEKLEDAKTAITLGALGYIGKPIHLDTLQSCVGKAATMVRKSARDRRFLLESEQMRTFFLSSVAHELRTPVNVLLTYLDLLKAQAGDPAGILVLVGDMLRATRRLKYLVNNTVVITSLDELLQVPDSRFVDAREVIRRELALLQDQIDEKHLTVIQNLGNPDVKARVNEKLFSCVVGGILNNAVKFSPVRGTVHVSIDAGSNPNPEMVELTVHDHGKGIPRSVLDSMETPFVYTGDTLTRQHSGAGMGLFLVKRIIKELGGSLFVESQETAVDGTLVRVKLPLNQTKPVETK